MESSLLWNLMQSTRNIPPKFWADLKNTYSYSYVMKNQDEVFITVNYKLLCILVPKL